MLARTAISLISASIIYFVWLALFLLSVQLDFDFAEAIIWIFAPAVTAAGFTLGLRLAERRGGGMKSGFAATYLWPLGGCILGTSLMFWLGATFIAVGMLAGGTIAVVVREKLLSAGG